MCPRNDYDERFNKKKDYFIYSYKGELFKGKPARTVNNYVDSDGRPRLNIEYHDDMIVLVTHIREKGDQFGFEEVQYNLFELEIPINEVVTSKIKSVTDDPYRVKYKDHFFSVEEEKEHEMLLMTNITELHILYNFKTTRDEIYPISVKRKETSPINTINNANLALYRGAIVETLDKKGDKILIGLDLSILSLVIDQQTGIESGWKKVNNMAQKWVNCDYLYIYGEEEYPLRV